MVWARGRRFLTIMDCLCLSFEIRSKSARKPGVRLRQLRSQNLWYCLRLSLPISCACRVPERQAYHVEWMGSLLVSVISISHSLSLTRRTDVYKVTTINIRVKEIWRELSVADWMLMQRWNPYWGTADRLQSRDDNDATQHWQDEGKKELNYFFKLSNL